LCLRDTMHGPSGVCPHDRSLMIAFAVALLPRLHRYDNKMSGLHGSPGPAKGSRLKTLLLLFAFSLIHGGKQRVIELYAFVRLCTPTLAGFHRKFSARAG
jgi:hypothetical protein